jgi:hypothetical protein
MEGKGKLRRVFPGSNSARGFFSFFDQIIAPEDGRVLVIKGGPGIGKSTFMSKIGKALQEYGYDVEYQHCASDSTSLDGLVVPALAVALIDGTFPHVFDPPYPGVAGEIIDLGRFWDAAGIREKKDRIIKLEAEIGRLFKQAHRLLAVAETYLQALESYYGLEGILDQGAWDRLTLRLIEEILTVKTKKSRGRVRRLFASAITPQGFVHHLDTLIEPLAGVYLFQGEYSSGKSKIIERIMDAALWRGFNVEAYHCALDPEKIDHIIIPELNTAIINSIDPHHVTFSRVCREIDSGEFIAGLPRELQVEKNTLDQSYSNALGEAIGFLAKAQSVYQELEGYYIPHMHFAEVDRLCRETLERILE